MPEEQGYSVAQLHIGALLKAKREEMGIQRFEAGELMPGADKRDKQSNAAFVSHIERLEAPPPERVKDMAVALWTISNQREEAHDMELWAAELLEKAKQKIIHTTQPLDPFLCEWEAMPKTHEYVCKALKLFRESFGASPEKLAEFTKEHHISADMIRGYEDGSPNDISLVHLVQILNALKLFAGSNDLGDGKRRSYDEGQPVVSPLAPHIGEIQVMYNMTKAAKANIEAGWVQETPEPRVKAGHVGKKDVITAPDSPLQRD